MIKAYKNKLASWMAIFAVLFAFFAPAISQAMPTDNHANVIYQKVCTEQGAKVVPVEMPAGKHSGGMAGHIGNCALCFSSSYTPVISYGVNLFAPSNQQASEGLALLYIAPAIELHQQLSHPSQAPPFI